jgi:hypothetical protein
MLVNGLDLTQARPRKNWLGRTPAAQRLKHFPFCT